MTIICVHVRGGSGNLKVVRPCSDDLIGYIYTFEKSFKKATLISYTTVLNELQLVKLPKNLLTSWTFTYKLISNSSQCYFVSIFLMDMQYHKIIQSLHYSVASLFIIRFIIQSLHYNEANSTSGTNFTGNYEIPVFFPNCRLGKENDAG